MWSIPRYVCVGTQRGTQGCQTSLHGNVLLEYSEQHVPRQPGTNQGENPRKEARRSRSRRVDAQVGFVEPWPNRHAWRAVVSKQNNCLRDALGSWAAGVDSDWQKIWRCSVGDDAIPDCVVSRTCAGGKHETKTKKNHDNLAGRWSTFVHATSSSRLAFIKYLQLTLTSCSFGRDCLRQRAGADAKCLEILDQPFVSTNYQSNASTLRFC